MTRGSGFGPRPGSTCGGAELELEVRVSQHLRWAALGFGFVVSQVPKCEDLGHPADLGFEVRGFLNVPESKPGAGGFRGGPPGRGTFCAGTPGLRCACPGLFSIRPSGAVELRSPRAR